MVYEYIAITGASSGIGEEYAKQLAKKKNNLILIFRNPDKQEDIKRELSKYGVNIKIILSDLSDLKNIEEVSTELTKFNVSGIINCAGFGNPFLFSKSDYKISKNMINVHVMASTLLTKAVLPNMVFNKKGFIINVSSLAAFINSTKSNTIYSATKMYLITFSKKLKKEVKNKNIKVQALCPGMVKTNFRKHTGYIKQNEKKNNLIAMSSERVVKYSLRKLKGNKVVCVPGILNKLAYVFLKHFN